MDARSLCGQAGDNPSHHRHRPTHKCMHACVMYVQVYRTDVLYVLDWWSDVCTGLVYYMYWTGVLYVLDWCVVCTGLGVLNWTGVLYVMDWCIELDWCVVHTGLVCCMYWTGVLYVLD